MSRVVAVVALLALAPATLGSQLLDRPAPDARIQKLVSGISEARLRAIVEKLSGFSTRHTLSDTASPTRGIGAARQWIFDELRRASPRLQVTFDSYIVAEQGRITRNVEITNVVAVLPGYSGRRIYVTAHYDTVSTGTGGAHAANVRPANEPAPPDPQLNPDQDYNTDAPGANDNGSGTALTMEVARVLASSGIPFDATLVFVLWAGEEQGLIGSRLHARHIGEGRVGVEAVLNNDIVGNSHGGNGGLDAAGVRVYSEGPEDSMSRSLARYIQRAAAVYVPSHEIRVMGRHDRFGRGSDHSPFNAWGYAAAVFREANENFARQHSPADTVDGVDFGYLAQNARVNVATAALLALAPAAPHVLSERGAPTIGRQPSGYDANLRWNPSFGATGYRIYWRDAWSLDWQHTRLVGDVTEYVLPGMSIDNYIFGVAAIGANGQESLVSAYVSPLRRDPDVKLVP